MRGILADVNIEGQVQRLLDLFQVASRVDLWNYLGLSTPTFADLVLPTNAVDRVVWDRCQQEQLVFLTGNRNSKGPDSLEEAIRTSNTPTSLPVITLTDEQRIMFDKAYANRTADKVLEQLFDIDRYLGCGRLYAP